MVRIESKSSRTRNVKVKDLFNLPSAISATGVGLVCWGATHIENRSGKLVIAAGRAADLLDGYVARKTNTESDAGAIVDAAGDKIGMSAIMLALINTGIAPKLPLAVMATKHTTNAIATMSRGIHDTDERSIRPSKSGKISMFADNVSIGLFMLADELPVGSKKRQTVFRLGYLAAAVGVGFGIDSTVRYLRGDFDQAS